MKVFENLRKRIVQKLIRPEDGYVYTGLAAEGQPIKFYYNTDKHKCVLGMRTMDEDYLIPTLTGWVDGRAYANMLKEIDFKQWIHLVLSDVCDEYYRRLDGISMKSLWDYKKQEKDGEIMITKKSFCDIMSALDSYWKNLRALEDVLNVYFERGMMMDIIDHVVDALEEEMEPEFYDPNADFGGHNDPLIMRWLIEFDAGRSDSASEGIDGHPLTSAEELYDYLVLKRDENKYDV